MTPLLNLPFDQYSRQKIVADAIGSIRKKDQKYNILDVGGYKGKTKEFLKHDKVTIIDVFDVTEDGYIKGDGTKMPFKDGEFDFVVCFDVLEHIPSNKRRAFIKECIRVSKLGYFLCCPFDSGNHKAAQAEKNLSSIYESFGKKHHWIQEHIDNGLPTQKQIEDALNANNITYCKHFSNSLDSWIILQSVFFLSDVLDVVSFRAGDMNLLYNQNLYEIEGGVDEGNAYRVIYYAEKNENYTKKIESFFKKTKLLNNVPSVTLELPVALAEVVQKKLSSQAETTQHEIDLLTAKSKEQETTIKQMENSRSWRLTRPIRMTIAFLYKIKK